MTATEDGTWLRPFCPPTSSICPLWSVSVVRLPCRAAAIRDERVGEHSLASAMSSIASSTRRLRRARRRRGGCARRRLRRRAAGRIRRPSIATAISRLHARCPRRSKSNAAPAGGRCRARTLRGDRRARSATSSTGDSARETVSQSSMVMVPSGRSAMICTVQPSSPEILTRTRR